MSLSFRTARRRLLAFFGTYGSHIFLGSLVVVFGVFVYNNLVYAATYTFTQSSWAGGADAVTVPTHPGNVTNWTKYSTKSGVTAGANVSLPATNHTYTDDGAGARTDYAVGSAPQSVAYDSFTDSIWVANNGTNNVTKLSASTGALIGTYNVGLTPYGIAFDSGSNSIWVTNMSDGTVTKLNASSGALVGTYAVGGTPRGVTFDSSTNAVWIANSGSDNVTKLNASTGALIGTYSVGTTPIGVAFDPSTNSVWVANLSSSNVTKLNASTGALIGTYGVGSTPFGVTFESSSNTIWVANYSSGNVTKLNASTGAEIGTYSAGSSPYNLAFDSSTNSIWVTNNAADTVTRLNASSGAVAGTYAVGSAPFGIAFSPTTNTVWVANSVNQTVSKVNASKGFENGTNSNTTVNGNGIGASVGLTGSIVQKDTRADYSVGASPQSVTFDSFTNSMWTVNTSDNTVTKRNASTGALIGTYAVGTTPQFVAFDSSTNSIWTANGAGTVTKLNASTGGLVGTYTVGTNPRGIAFDSSTNSVWVANGGSTNVTKLSASTGAVVGTYAVATNPVQITFDPSTNSMWVTAATNKVYKLNTSTGATTGTYAVNTPRGIAFDSSTNSIWVADTSESSVVKLNASTGAIVGTYATKGSAAYAVTFDSATNSIWVANAASDNVSKIKASDGSVIATYAVGTSPWGVAFDSSTNSVWTSNVNGSSVTKLSSEATAISYSIGISPYSNAFDPSTNSIWTTNKNTSSVTKVNALSGTVIGTYAVGTGPHGITFDSLTNSIWVSNSGSDTVSKLNASTGAAIGTYAVGSNPEGVTFDPSTNSIWVANYTSSTVTKLNASTGGVVGTYSVGLNPIGITFDSSTNSIWTANSGTNTVTKLNAASGAVSGTYTGGSFPIAIAFDSSTNSIWTTNASNLSKLNASTGAVIGTYSIPGSAAPWSLTFDSSTNSIWVTNQVNGYFYVAKLNAATGNVIVTYDTVSNPYGVAFDSTNNAVWIASSGNNLIKIPVSGLIYSTSGSFTSAVIDLGGPVAAQTFGYSQNTPTGTTIATYIRAGNTSTPDGSWTGWTPVGNFGSIDGFSGRRYFQYSAVLGTTNTSVTPTLNDVTIYYSQYGTSGSLTSSVYDTGDSHNLIARVSWVETATTTNNTVKFQVRSSPDNVTWSAWCGYADCSGSTYFADGGGNGQDMATNHPLRSGNDDRYIQYKAYFASDGGGTPVLTSVSMKYVINAPPDFDVTYGTNGVTVSQDAVSTGATWGKVLVSYKVRDTDTDTGTINSGLITPSFEYSTNNGSTWTGIPAGDMRATDITNKAVDKSIYTTYSAVWTATSTAPNTFSSTVKVRVTANDNEAANNVGTAVSAAISLDTTPPVVAATIDASTGATTGTVTLSITDGSQSQYRLCNDAAFPTTDAQGNSCAWSALGGNLTNSTISWTPLKDSADNEPVYLQTRDAYGNSTAQTIVAPSTPKNFDIKDVSNPSINVYKEFLSWSVFAPTTGSSFTSYKLYNSTDGTTYTLLSTINDPATNYYVHTVSTGTTTVQYYKAVAITSQGNTSAYTIVLSDTPNGQGGTDTTAPTIDPASIVVPAQNLKNTSALVTFTTDELAKGAVQFRKSGTTPWTTVTSPTYALAHSIYIQGLLPNTTYNVKVSAQDVPGNTSDYVSGPDFTTEGGPVITDVSETDISDSGATIAWNTSTSSDSYVIYSQNQDLSSPTSVGSGNQVTCVNNLCQHRVSISSLSAGITYYFYVSSTDYLGNVSTDNNSGTYYSFHTTVDTTPPIISNISEPVVAMTSAVIVWQTDEPSSSQVTWGTAPGTLSRATIADPTKSIYHIVTLSSGTNDTSGSGQALTAVTQYYFKVTSTDAAGNSSSSNEQTFTTADAGSVRIITQFATAASGNGKDGTGVVKDATPPTITSVTSDTIGAFSADIHVATSKNTTTFVSYGPTTSYGSTEGNDLLQASKTITLNRLQEGTTYHYRVKAVDDLGNFVTGDDQTFKTIFASEELDKLTTLEKATDLQGKLERLIQSALPSLAPPFITKPDVSNITENSATVSWNTNIKAYGSLRYATDEEYAAAKNDYKVEVSAGQTEEASHSVDLASLEPNTLYHVQARSYVFPQVVGTSPDITFSTKAAAVVANIVAVKNDGFTVVWQTVDPTSSVVNYRNLKTGDSNIVTDESKKTYHNVEIKNLPSGTTYSVQASGVNRNGNAVGSAQAIRVTTTVDLTPPVISNFKVDNALIPGRTDLIQTVVGWQTDKPANSAVFYQEGASGNSTTTELKNKVETLDTYTTAHIMILASLKPGTVYRLKVVSADQSGNTKVFGPTSIITPKQTQSVLDIIVKNFEETFKFLGAGQ